MQHNNPKFDKNYSENSTNNIDYKHIVKSCSESKKLLFIRSYVPLDGAGNLLFMEIPIYLLLHLPRTLLTLQSYYSYTF